MKRTLAFWCAAALICAAAIFRVSPASAQQQIVYCNVQTLSACNTVTNPGSGTQGDPAFIAFGKVNANFSQWYGVAGIIKGVSGSAPARATYADVAALFTGCSGSNVVPDLLTGACVSTSGGSVSTVSVVSANGLSGSVATPTTTPAITLAPTFTGISYSTGSAFQAAVPANFPTLNQSTTGNAATATALAATPTLCSSGQAAQGILVSGNATGCFTPTGSGTVNSGTANDLAYYAATGTAVSQLALSGCLTISSGTLSLPQLINAQTGTSYKFVASDGCKLVTFSNAAATAVTLPQATGSFGVGFSVDVENLGAGLVTITPTTSTVNGAATLAIAQNQGCTLTSDGTNYQVSACSAVGANANEVNGAAVPASATVLGTNSSKQLVAESTVTYLLDEGTKFTLGTGTGACASTSTLVGGTSVGSFECTGTTGSSTAVVNLPSAPNGIWVCHALDKTTPANVISETAYTATTATLSGTVTANDVLAFGCIGS